MCGSSTTESARSIPRSARRPCPVSRKKPPYAASTWYQHPSRRATAPISSSGSTAPVSVAPAAATTSHGLSPRARSAAMASASASGRIRHPSSIATYRTGASPIPAMWSAFSMQWCACAVR